MTSKTQRRAKPDPVERMVSMFPQVVNTVNTILEAWTKGVSKKAGVLLWSVYFSNKEEDGKFLLTQDIVKTFQRWFAVRENTARKYVTGAKGELLKRGFIVTHHGLKRIYLTSEGEEFVRQMHQRAVKKIPPAIKSLNDEEMHGFLDILDRVIQITLKQS